VSLSNEDRAIVEEAVGRVPDDLIDDVVAIHRNMLTALYAERAALDRAIQMRQLAVINLLDRRDEEAS
jgi:predicted site-specific integrase-resolvase